MKNISRPHDLTTLRSFVLFDFDGTLSAGDAMGGFFWYCFRHALRPWLFLPIVILGLLIMPLHKNGIVWREMTRRFISRKLIKKFAPAYLKKYRKNIFAWSRARVADERAAGNIVVLTSAGPDYLILPLVRDFGFDYIITSETESARPYKYIFFNHDSRKVLALTPLIAHGTVVRAYSDSSSDLPMMNLAREQIWVNPKTGEFRAES